MKKPQLCFRLDPELLNAVRMYAAIEDRTLSYFVERCVKEEIMRRSLEA